MFRRYFFDGPSRSIVACILGAIFVSSTPLVSDAADGDPSQSGKLHALVIGNGDYKTGQLRNPSNDAAAISKSLRSLGFQVTELINIGQQETEDAILNFSRSIRDDGLAFFFFAGHGVQVKGENYLIPIDAKIREEFEVRHQCVSLSLVLDALENSSSNLNVLVLDCCRDNPFQRSWSRSSRAGLAATSEIPEGTLIAYATSPGATAADGQGDNSPYTMELAKALSKRPETGLLLRDAFFEASRNVKNKTGQSPWINMEASLSKFYLTRPGGNVAASASAPTPLADQPVDPSSSYAASSLPPKPVTSGADALPDPGAFPSRPKQSSLEVQANLYLRTGDYTNAIEAFGAIIDDPSLPAETRRRARKARGSAYLSRGGELDIDRAIIDHKAAGLKGIRIPARVSSSPLKVGSETKGYVHRNQILFVTLARDGWLWVESINDNDSLSGYVKKTAVLEPKAPEVVSTAKTSQPQQPKYKGQPSITSAAQPTSNANLYQPQGTYPTQNQASIPQSTQGTYQQPTQSTYPRQTQGAYTQQNQSYTQPNQVTNGQQGYYTQPRTTYNQPQRYQSSTTNRGYSQPTQSRTSPYSPWNANGTRKTFRQSFIEGYNRADAIFNGSGRRK